MPFYRSSMNPHAPPPAVTAATRRVCLRCSSLGGRNRLQPLFATQKSLEVPHPPLPRVHSRTKEATHAQRLLEDTSPHTRCAARAQGRQGWHRLALSPPLRPAGAAGTPLPAGPLWKGDSSGNQSPPHSHPGDLPRDLELLVALV